MARNVHRHVVRIPNLSRIKTLSDADRAEVLAAYRCPFAWRAGLASRKCARPDYAAIGRPTRGLGRHEVDVMRWLHYARRQLGASIRRFDRTGRVADARAVAQWQRERVRVERLVVESNLPLLLKYGAGAVDRSSPDELLSLAVTALYSLLELYDPGRSRLSTFIGSYLKLYMRRINTAEIDRLPMDARDLELLAAETARPDQIAARNEGLGLLRACLRMP